MMLGFGQYHFVSFSEKGSSIGLCHQINGFGGVAGENKLFGAWCSNEFGQLFAGMFVGFGRLNR